MQYITASTELLVVDQAEMLLMQNWANVQQIIGMLNQRPTKAAFSSAARIRLAYLAGYGKLYRQTLIFSAVAAPQIMLLAGECENFQGFNYIPPLPCYPGLYPTYLPDHVRIPGLKPVQTQTVNGAPLHPAKKARVVPSNDQSAPGLPDVKLTLIPFAVFGQTDSGPQNPVNSNSDSDDEDVNDEMTITTKINTHSNSNQLVVSAGPLPEKSLIALSDRAIPLARLNAFKQRVLPRLRRGLDPRVLIYVPDFYDLEELRLLLRAESLDFCCIHE
ncbi:unnamed protein product [Echinostoma caproni]|uniref:UTP25 NTP hydrolase-like domain-containing protein n=1 Tax=Echinostoma caproni TaxID=27848 RepID=A0A3P8IFX2_9TREM|nr:unnamed protein product [Echinostoma caproni]